MTEEEFRKLIIEKINETEAQLKKKLADCLNFDLSPDFDGYTVEDVLRDYTYILKRKLGQ
jgi:hypothetical protein